MKKRSRHLSLVLMSSLTLGVAGCGDESIKEEFKAYTSIHECVQDQVFSAEECRSMAIAAVEQNPRFASQADCEKEFGEHSCKNFENIPQESASINGSRRTGSSWMPLMAGYMMGRYMGGSGPMQGAQPLYSQPQQGQPASGAAGTRTSGGFATSYRTLGGGTVQTDAGGRVTNPSGAVRQGFGKSAKPFAARSGGGTRGGFSGSGGSAS